MTRPGIEPGPPGPLVNTLTIMPMSGRDIFSGKSIYNRETISRQEHKISKYRIMI